jgi:hypothetical protein
MTELPMDDVKESGVIVQICRARCAHCGNTQIVAKRSKGETEWILINMLGWVKTARRGLICRECAER